MLMVLAKLGTAAMVGQFVLALAVTTPVMAFFMLQLRSVQATDAHGEYRFGDYLGLRLTTAVMAMVTVAAICLASGYDQATMLIILAAAASAAVDSISDVVYGLLQQRERMDRIALSMIVRGAVALAALAAATLTTRNVFYGILAIAATRALMLVLYDLPSAAIIIRRGASAVHARGYERLLPRCELRKTLALAKLSLPLGVVMMLIGLSASIPRYFVEHYWGSRCLGIFGALGYLGLVGSTAVAAIGQSATPRLAQCYAARQRKAFNLLLLQLTGVGAALGLLGVVVAIVAGEQILALVYGAEYAAHNAILVWLMLAAGLGYVAAFAGYGVTAARYFKAQIPLFAGVVAATAAACWWLVPKYGMLGAALSLLVAALTQLVGAGLILAHAVRSPARVVSLSPGVRGDDTRDVLTGL
jgi:O-antigen/teichoic acid export membrane protein